MFVTLFFLRCAVIIESSHSFALTVWQWPILFVTELSIRAHHGRYILSNKCPCCTRTRRRVRDWVFSLKPPFNRVIYRCITDRTSYFQSYKASGSSLSFFPICLLGPIFECTKPIQACFCKSTIHNVPRLFVLKWSVCGPCDLT